MRPRARGRTAYVFTLVFLPVFLVLAIVGYGAAVTYGWVRDFRD